MVAGSDVAALTIALSAARGRGAPVTDVVHLCSIDTHLTDTTTTDALWHGQERLLTDALQIVQMLGAMVAAPALSIVTRGAQSAEARESANPAQATVWGFSHVVAIEHPELRCRRIDLDPSADDTACLDALHRELRAADASDDQVALRDSRRLVRRLVHYSPQAAATVTIGADRSYLITGGLRGLGLRTAEWLVERGARALVLMGRQAPDEAARAVIARLEARGAHVLAVQGDVSAEADVRRVLETITASMSPLAGIVHAAGALDDGVIAAQNWSRFSHVMAAKLRGTWHLHRLTSELDFFVLFSSGASVAGSAGQVNHAAANAFEDAFAWYRQALGQPTVSINWGPWADIGAAADRQVTGGAFLRPIPPDDGLRALEVALRVEPEGTSFVRAQVVVLAADWSQITTSASPLLQSPLFRRLAPAGVTARESHAALTAPALSLRERLQSTAANRRRAALIDEVRQLTVRVLGIHQSDALDINEPLRQLGLDSLMAVELRNLLGTVVERTLPATITFDHPTVHALVEFLAAEVFAAELSAPGSAEGTAAPATPFAAGSAQDLDDMSNDELALRLAQRLDALGSEDLS
jgi:NAD(P)-dependent dehydrogenase (short-subunit alcohol dehydrogenase family)